MAETPLIAIIGAMDSEIAALKEQINHPATSVIQGVKCTTGSLEGTPVVVARCGVGMVGAASCTQVLLDRYSVAAVINTGVAGSLDAHIDIGDLVIAADAVNHVMDVQNLGYAPGQNPDFDLVAFPTDNTLRTSAFEIAREMGLTAHEGRIASGDRFVRENTDKQRIVDTFKARCCEMEGAAIAQVCWRTQVPCALVRAISDKADGSASVDYPAFEAQAGRRCAALVAHLVQRIRL